MLGGSQKLENVCRQRFRILKIIQVEPYMIADVEYGFSGNHFSPNSLSDYPLSVIGENSLIFFYFCMRVFLSARNCNPLRPDYDALLLVQ